MPLAPLTYPAPRALRAGPTPTILAPRPEGEAIIPPEVTVFTFILSTVANSRSTVSSRLLHGPAVLRSYDIVLGGAPNGVQSLEIGISGSSVLETNVGINVVRPWRTMFTRFNLLEQGDPPGRIGLPQPDFGSSVRAAVDNLNFVILETDFFLTITNWSSGAGADQFAGSLVIAERVAPEVIANFL